MSQPAFDRRSQGLWSWLPLGLWTASVLALLRAALVAELIRLRVEVRSQSESAIRDWEIAQAFPSALLGALIIGCLAAVVAQRAARLTAGARFGGLALGGFVFLAASSFVAGWIGEPEWSQARYASGHFFSHQSVVAALCFFATAFLFHFSRSVQRGLSTRRYLSGIPASLCAAVLGLLAPLSFLWLAKRTAPTFQERRIAYEFLAHPADWRVLEAQPDSQPTVSILTPAVAQETDSGDKPALILPPGTTLELSVPAEGDHCLLRAAAAVDKSVRGQMPAGLESLEVEFELALDGQSIFRERIRSERLRDGVYAPADWVWRHVGGPQGIPVRAGQKLRLSTRFPAGTDLPALPPGYPKVGFGGLFLERQQTQSRQRASPTAPNIILIVMDTLRADRLSCYGHQRPTTPHLDRLAARGRLYENAYATASWTWPSTASILTGLEPEVHGVLSQEQCTLQHVFESLPEALQARGYTTHGVSCNPLIAPERYFDQGFESFVPPPKQSFRKSDEVMPEIVRWVRAHRGVRFFLYLHLVDPHTPHHPHPDEVLRLGLEAPADFPEQGMDHYNALLQQGSTPKSVDSIVPPEHQRWISEQYDASVATGDRWLGLLFESLRELDLLEHTLIAFTADHGEELFDHELLEHGHTLYDELVRVPLILAGPGIAQGERESALVSLRDLAPTLALRAGTRLAQAADAGNLLTPSEQGLAQFQTYKGVWLSKEASGANVWQKRQQLSGIRQGHLVLHWRADGAGAAREDLRLFDNSLDHGQQTDLAAERPGESQRLLALLRKRLDYQRSLAPEIPIGSSAAIEALLQAIGYAEGDEDGAGD